MFSTYVSCIVCTHLALCCGFTAHFLSKHLTFVMVRMKYVSQCRDCKFTSSMYLWKVFLCYFVIPVLLYKTNLEISAHLCMQMISQESRDSQERLLVPLQLTVFCMLQIIVNVSVVSSSLAIS